MMSSPVERTLVAFTITFLATAPAHASHPPQALHAAGTEGSASSAAPADFDFVGTARPRGLVFARQIVPAPPPIPPSGGGALSSSPASPVVALAAPATRTRTIYLNRGGALLRPGTNDARLATSSIVKQPTRLAAWDIDDDTWAETVACMRELYARFDVVITDRDPGDAPHVEAVFGGHPSDVGLPDEVAGVSPFATDCSVIENSVVFTFTDVLPDDPRVMCEVMAQEIAHSFGLDHEMLPSDPMTYLEYDGERAFQDVLASCGEDAPRPCGIGGRVCRDKQNSVELLGARLGRSGHGAPATPERPDRDAAPEAGGCQTSGVAGAPVALALAGLVGLRRRRRRYRAATA